VIHSLAISDCADNLVHKFRLNLVPVRLYLTSKELASIRLVSRDIFHVDSIGKPFLLLEKTNNVRPRCDINTDIGGAKFLNELIYLPKFVIPALIQRVEENSNIDGLGALYEELNNGIVKWSIATDMDIVIYGFEIGPIFVMGHRDLLEKAGCYVVGRLCCSLFQVEVDINWDNIRSFKVFDSSGTGLLEFLFSE